MTASTAGTPPATDPAHLITDEDVMAAVRAWEAAELEGNDRIMAMLQALAPIWHARWVAEALDAIVADLNDVDTTDGIPVLTKVELRALAAEYRDGTR